MKTQFWLPVLFSAALGHAQSNVPIPAEGNVALPLDQYNQLVARADQAPSAAPAPPFSEILNSVRMDLHVDQDSVSGTAVIDGEVLAQGDRKVPLVRGMVIRAAQLQAAAGQTARDLPVEQEGGLLSALLPGPAPFSVKLDTAVPLEIEPGRASFSLPAPRAGAVQATISIPGDQTQVNLSPGLITSRASRDGRTVIEATLVPGTVASVWWAARLSASESDGAPREVRFLSDVKTLLTVGDAEISAGALAEVTVIQGEPSEFTITAPEGYELVGATGPTLVSAQSQKGSIRLTVSNTAARTHQFLISLARSTTGSSAEVPLITFEGTQRETGEVLVEGEGATELTASERGVLRRMDLKETNPYLRSMARGTLHTAFRYQKRPGETPTVALEWVRFPNAKVLSAVAEHAVATTLVTSEGRTLTEVSLTLQNQSQPFLKLDLPAGASILSADVAGEKVKPVQGTDGSRVPLLRPGFHPSGSYSVSFVFLHAGTPFARKGSTDLTLPKMDVPIARLEWEVFLPQRYKVTDFGGDALPARLLPLSSAPLYTAEPPPLYVASNSDFLRPGDVGGRVVDPAGAVIVGTNVVVEAAENNAKWSTVTDQAGRWKVSDVPFGPLRVTATSPGFRVFTRQVTHYAGRATELGITLQVGSSTETVTVTAEAPVLSTETAELSVHPRQPRAADYASAPSANVTNLQQRVTGVLPIAIDVPRAGNSYRFVRALTVDEETSVTFRYRAR